MSIEVKLDIVLDASFIQYRTHRGQELTIQIEKPLSFDCDVEFRHLFDQFPFRTVQTIVISGPEDKLFDIFGQFQLLHR